MQRNAVAFRIDHHRTKTVRSDLRFLFQDFSAIGAHGLDRVIEPSFHRKINAGPVCDGVFLEPTLSAPTHKQPDAFCSSCGRRPYSNPASDILLTSWPRTAE